MQVYDQPAAEDIGVWCQVPIKYISLITIPVASGSSRRLFTLVSFTVLPIVRSVFCPRLGVEAAQIGPRAAVATVTGVTLPSRRSGTTVAQFVLV